MNPYDDEDTVDELPAPPRAEIPAADRELLELAGRAIGAVHVEDVDGENWVNLHFADGSAVYGWNPLQFSGDALDLAVTLRITPHIDNNMTEAEGTHGFSTERHFDDPHAATRRAITRGAAEVGKQRS